MSDTNIDQARFNMIEQQIRPWNVFSLDVLETLTELPREEFAPEKYKSLAFADTMIPLSDGQVMMEPKVEGRLLQNLNITKGLIFSQELMLELTKTGLSREKSYRMVQNYAKKCFAENLDLFNVIQSDKYIISKIPSKKLKIIFSYSKHFRNINLIYRRVFN